MWTPKPTTILSLAVSLFFFFYSSHLDVDSRLLPIINEHGSNASAMQVYIVHVQKPKGTKFLQFRDRKNWYMSFLPNATLSSGEPRMVYAYRQVISGFAAWLTHEESQAMEAMDGFVLSHPEAEYVAETTQTPGFLGLSPTGDGLWGDAIFGQGITIGVMDTGIKPTHPSFDDAGMPPQPPNWKGQCYWGPPICNNKLIGAMGFQHGWYPDPIDTDGHGTHTASTAAGTFVADAEVLGQAKGTASGTAPRAHLAIYKVLHRDSNNQSTGTDADILKGIDQAIRDGVDILSMSLADVKPKPLHESSVVIGSYAAMTKGIFPCAAAGNSGPTRSIIKNDAPWIFTVGASSTQRRIRTVVRLGNGVQYNGESAYQPAGGSTKQLPLVYPGIPGINEALFCEKGTLDSFDLKGKIVICLNGNITDVEKGEVVKKAGGAGMIVLNDPTQGNTTAASAHHLPASNVHHVDALEIIDYDDNTKTPMAEITFKGTQFGVRPSPAIASFSSRGPSLINGNIIKPDITAPGVNILAAWPNEVGPNPTGTRKTFNFVSGTSMATPHVSGIVALLKNTHPTWSVAAIKSAIMTTANTKDLDRKPISDEANGTEIVFAMGSGHINPTAANDPGLIYDLEPYEYTHYLCGAGFTDRQVTAITRGPVRCRNVRSIPAENLNYPSIGVYFGSSSTVKTAERTVTNVGEASEYMVQVDEPAGVRVVVSPTTLRFTQDGQQESFTVTLSIKGRRPAAGESFEGQLSWVSPKYLVRSPIAAMF